jgi:hypothetical protein
MIIKKMRILILNLPENGCSNNSRTFGSNLYFLIRHHEVYFLLAFSTLGMNVYGQKTVDQKVAELLSKMTLEEKGQMVQYSGFEYATGPQHSNSAAVLEEIKKGKVGSMLNVAGSEETRAFRNWPCNRD